MEKTETPEQKELRQAQERVETARRKMALMEELKLQKLQADIAARKANEERALFEAQEKARAIEQMWLDRRAKEKEQFEQAERAKQEDEARLQREYGKAEEEKRQREEHEAALQRAHEISFQLEQDAEKIARELTQQTTETEEDAVQPTSLPPSAEQTNGLEDAVGGLESASPGAWGNERLRALLRHQS